MVETRRALITGITGQDGSYLSELLLAKGYEVHGIAKLDDEFGLMNVEGIAESLHLTDGDLRSRRSLEEVFGSARPDEVYNLAAQSSVPRSWEDPGFTFELDGLAVLLLLEVIRDLSPRARLFQAASSEIFGKVDASPQDEGTALRPRNPYGTSKVFAYHAVRSYRERHSVLASNGILYNHESPRRGPHFVTRKITDAVARISEGALDRLYLGNLDARRDWGWAPDYVFAEWIILQADEPDDYVVATGRTHSIREFLDAAFGHVGIDDWSRLVEVKEEYYRPAEAVELCGDPTKARRRLGWEPSVSFEEMVSLMVDADLERLRGQAIGIEP